MIFGNNPNYSVIFKAIEKLNLSTYLQRNQFTIKEPHLQNNNQLSESDNQIVKLINADWESEEIKWSTATRTAIKSNSHHRGMRLNWWTNNNSLNNKW